MLGWQARAQLQEAEVQWIEYSRRADEADFHLDHVKSEFGYGGMIHNFKNYILRQDPFYLTWIKQRHERVQSEISDVSRYTHNDEERQLLATIAVTFDEYMKNLQIAEDQFSRGMGSREVDKLVTVDDAPALEALKRLDEIFILRSVMAREQTQQAINSVSSTLKALFFLVPVTVLLGIALIVFLYRVTNANRNISEVKDELDNLLNSAPDAILSVRADGSIIRANKSAEQLFGYPHDQLIHLKVKELIPKGMRVGHDKLVQDRFTRTSPRPFSASKGLFALSADGREFPVEISISFVAKGDEQIAIVIIRDTTERYKSAANLHEAHAELKKRVEQRTEVLLKTNAELEKQIERRRRVEDQLDQSSKMASIGEMSSSIAHDLSQPMNIIRMNVEGELLKISRGKGELESVKEILSKVDAQIMRMNEIVDRMRALSDGDMPDAPPVVNVRNKSIVDGKAKAKAKAKAGAIKILVVDDEEDAAHSLSEFLEDLGHLVYTAYNGQEAISIFDSDPADIVITDIRMPVMDGIELIRLLRERSADISIFAMTGHSPMGAEAEVQYGAVTGIWKKPLSLSEVAKILHGEQKS